MRTSQITLSSFAVAALSFGLQAQSITTGTNMGVFARSGSNAALKFVKKGTKLTLPASETAQLRGVSASTRVGLTRSGTSAVASIGEQAQVRVANSSAGTSASDDPRNIAAGAHSFRLELPARDGARFVVVATLSGRTAGRSTASASVDIDNDGTNDWTGRVGSQPVTQRWVVTAGKTGIALGMSTQALASVGTTVTATGYQALLRISVSPATSSGSRCTITRQGASCGPVLAARETRVNNRDVLNFQTTRARAGGAAFFILGDRVLNVRFPGTRCGLYTNPLIIFGRQVDRQGQASIRFEIPSDFAGRFVSQDIILSRSSSGAVIQSTNGLGVTCRKAQQ